MSKLPSLTGKEIVSLLKKLVSSLRGKEAVMFSLNMKMDGQPWFRYIQERQLVQDFYRRF
jgi:hypothetical protein